MKIISIILLLMVNLSFSQNASEQENALVADVDLSIWDSKNSESSFKIEEIIYDEIPKDLDFRGTTVTILKWIDGAGENILILSKSGYFDWKDYNENDKSNFDIQDKSELYVYLFQKPKGQEIYKKQWRIYDFIECYGVDMAVEFKNNATTITDLDNNGIGEVAIPYALYCRGGMDPGIMKIILYDGNSKYALRGETAICRDNELLYGGSYKARRMKPL